MPAKTQITKAKETEWILKLWVLYPYGSKDKTRVDNKKEFNYSNRN